jgi:hypothetical protein
MIKFVIWIDLNAQSVCTYQIWNFLILWCSTWLEDSKDYKFVIFGWTEQKIWIKQVNRRVWFNLKMISIWIPKLLFIIALMDSTCSKDSNGILFVNFRVTDWKLWFLQVCRYLKEFKSNLNQNRPRHDMWLIPIGPYHFVWISDLERQI